MRCLDFTAGGIPEVWLTAFQLLHFVGHVKANDTVLIHAGGSGRVDYFTEQQSLFTATS